jgi:hypothetical protein
VTVSKSEADYGTADEMNDAASRVEAIVDDDMSATHLADYSYIGLGTFVHVDYTQPDGNRSRVGWQDGQFADCS